jgi:hypothetical protein
MGFVVDSDGRDVSLHYYSNLERPGASFDSGDDIGHHRHCGGPRSWRIQMYHLWGFCGTSVWHGILAASLWRRCNHLFRRLEAFVADFKPRCVCSLLAPKGVGLQPMVERPTKW